MSVQLTWLFIMNYPFYPRDAMLERYLLSLRVCPSLKVIGVLVPFHWFIDSEQLLKVTGSYVHCTCGKISETVPDIDIHVYYRPLIEVIWGLSNKGNSDNLGWPLRLSIAILFKLSFRAVMPQLKYFNWHSASRGSSAIAELLVITKSTTAWRR